MEAEIQRMLARVADAFRRRDARAVAERYHSNARHTRPSGGVAVGRAAIAEMLPAIFEMLPPDIETEVVSQNIDLITSDLAIVDQRVRNVRRTLTGQREVVSDEGFTVVVVKEVPEWRIAAMRGAHISHARLLPAGLLP